MKVKEGDKVLINDHSEAQGYPGKVVDIMMNGLVLIDIGECLWPVYEHEVVMSPEHHEKRDYAHEDQNKHLPSAPP
jgi:hypothetical protein